MRLSVTSRGRRNLPFYKKLEKNMLAACRAAGASAWYVPDDYVVLGPELVANGNFSSGLTGWTQTNPSAAAVVGGELEITASGSTAYPGATQLVKTTVGKTYKVTMKSRRGTSAASTGVVISRYAGSGHIVAVAINATTTAAEYTTFITSDWATWTVLPHASGSPAAAGTVYFDDISIREILSAKAFQDSAGTLPTYLGGTLGLGLDSAGTVSAELMPAYDFTSGSWSVIGTPSGVIPNGFTNASGTTAGLVIAAASVGLVQGKTYRISIPYSKSESASSLSVRIAAGTDVASASASSGVITGVATAGSTGLQLRYANNGTVTFGAISVKEISGNHVTQATAGNRPLVSRIPRKLGPEKALAPNYVVATGGYDNAISGVSASGFTCVAGTTASRVALNFPTEIGKTYNITTRLASGPASGTVQAYSRNVANGAGATISFTPIMTVGAIYNFQFTATSTTSSVLWVAAVAAQGFAIDSVSVKEVFEFSNALTFDGTNDSLATAASVIGSNLSQPYTMIAWGKVGAIGAARWLVGDSARSLGVANTGRPYATNHGVVNSNATTTLVAGQSLILESTWDGAMLAIYMNGVKESEIASAAPTAPAGATTIGQRGGGTEYWNSDIGGCVVCPAVMTEAQRAAVRKFAAAQMGLII